MSKYRLKYQKGEEARYISHLDFIRTIGRTIKRAKLPVKYSQGFNPHMVMTVALPISVGVTSDSEYMDVSLVEDVCEKDLVNILNQNMPLGIKILKAKKLLPNDTPLSRVSSAKYLVEAECEGEIDVEKFLNLEEILAEKKTKRGINTVDIKEDIINLECNQIDNSHKEFKMHLSAGNTRNLKPETVINALKKYFPSFTCHYIKVKRVDMLFDDNVQIL